MLTEIYIEALLCDENLADLVWELWDADVIDDAVAAIAWLLLTAPAIRQASDEIIGDMATVQIGDI